MSYDPSTKAGGNPTTVTATRKLLALDDSGNFADVTAGDLLAFLVSQGVDISARLSSSSSSGSSGSSGSTTPAAATSFTVALSSASGTVGGTTTMTVTPGSGGWPSGVTVTPSTSAAIGSFSPASASPSGTTAASFTFTSSATGTTTLNASASGMTSGGGQTYTATSAASGGSGYPSLTFNPAASFVTSGQKFGTGALSGGKGTLQFTVPQYPGSSVATMGVADLEFWFKAAAGTTSFTGSAAFIKMVDSAGNEWGLKGAGTGLNSTYGAGDYATGNVRDGGWHHIRMNVRSDYNQQNYIEVLVDGGATQAIKYDATPGIKTGTATLTIDFANLASGDLIDEVWITSDSRRTVPSAAGSRDSATLVLLHLDGNGAGS